MVGVGQKLPNYFIEQATFTALKLPQHDRPESTSA